MPDRDRDGALGLAIVKSVFDGVTPELNDISSHLGVNKEVLWKAFRRLKMNGIFQDDRISRETLKDDDTNWCFYAGYASGYIGPWLPDEDKNG
ncbi:MAG TPA: hypothetical protein ENH60_12520 [Pricia sp.]|nr:hypothetical protein [Pricia sp.]